VVSPAKRLAPKSHKKPISIHFVLPLNILHKNTAKIEQNSQ
jgi:hypothetical protein